MGRWMDEWMNPWKNGWRNAFQHHLSLISVTGNYILILSHASPNENDIGGRHLTGRKGDRGGRAE